MAIQEFRDLVVNTTSCDNCSDEEQLALEQVRATLLSSLGYSVYIGRDKAKEIGHSPEALITDCRLVLLEGRGLKKVPCFPKTDMLYRFDVNFYNCYILRLPTPSFPDLFVIGVSLVLHLDNFFMDHVLYFDKTNTFTRSAGVELSLHKPETLPMLGFEGKFLPPGYITDVKLKFARRTRLGHPHGNCSTVNESGNREYTLDYCYSSCVERMVSEVCGCEDFSPYSENSDGENHRNLTNCIDLRQGREELLEKWRCVERERHNAVMTCASRCTLPCEEVQYQTQVNIRWEYSFDINSVYEMI